MIKTGLAHTEAVAALILSGILVFVLPFRWSRRLFGDLAAAEDTTRQPDPAQMARARAVTRRLRRIAHRLPWHSTCLVMALSGRMLLARRGISGGVVRIGVRMENGRVAAHAWLMLGTTTLLGGDEAPDYRPLADLA